MHRSKNTLGVPTISVVDLFKVLGYSAGVEPVDAAMKDVQACEMLAAFVDLKYDEPMTEPSISPFGFIFL